MRYRAIVFCVSLAASSAAYADNSCKINHLNLAALENVAVMRDDGAADSGTTPTLVIQETTGLIEKTGDGLPAGGRALGYTRLRLRYTPCETVQVARYSHESRSAFERFFASKIDNHVLKFDVDIEPLGVKSSSQLYSMLRNSGKDGQSWSTDIRNDDFLLPYFRLDTSTVINFAANFQSEGSSKFDIGGSLLDIIQRGSALIAPSAVLITDANKPRFNDAANFVDGSLSKLFYKKVMETARQGIAVAPSESKEQHLVGIVLVAPNPRKTYITDDIRGRVIGRWDIYAERLIKSLFAPVDSTGQPDVRGLDSASVLNFRIGDKEVLRERLASNEAINRAAQAVAKAGDDKMEETAVGLCHLVATEATKVGLAPHDAALAAWAFVSDQAMTDSRLNKAKAACSKQIRYFPVNEG